MHFKKIEGIYLIRLERGEEIHATLIPFCKQNGITAGWINGIGAISQAELGYFHRDSKSYSWRRITSDHELTSLMGNISLKDGEPWLHLHATLSDENFQVTAGHLKSGVISVTGEIWIHSLKGVIERRLDSEFQSYLLHLEN